MFTQCVIHTHTHTHLDKQYHNLADVYLYASNMFYLCIKLGMCPQKKLEKKVKLRMDKQMVLCYVLCGVLSYVGAVLNEGQSLFCLKRKIN